jgi:hypothetical protein
MALDQKILRDIERIIQEECAAVDEYVKLIKQEQEHVVKLQSDKVTELSEKRAVITDTLAVLRNSRDELVRVLNGNTKLTLTELITNAGSASDKRRFLPLVNKLKARLKTLDGKTREFNQIINFSLGLVNGSLSILWSATQTVTRCYNAFGAVTESFQPTAPRVGTLLGKA